MSMMIEYFGTAASVIVAISLTQKNIKRLRILNLVGAVGFSLYGLLIRAWPVMGLNAFIAVIDAYYLIDMKRRKNYFEMLEIDRPVESVYLKKFIDFYSEDIKSFMPEFGGTIEDDMKAVFVLRDLLPVSLVIYREKKDGIEIIVDYAIQAYRDLKNASFFFEKIAETFKEGDIVFYTAAGSDIHNRYLQRMGFRYSDEDKRYFYR